MEGPLGLYSLSLVRAYPARRLPDDDTAGSGRFFCHTESLPAGTTAGRPGIVRSGAATLAFHCSSRYCRPDRLARRFHSYCIYRPPRNSCLICKHTEKTSYRTRKTGYSATKGLCRPFSAHPEVQVRQSPELFPGLPCTAAAECQSVQARPRGCNWKA